MKYFFFTVIVASLFAIHAQGQDGDRTNQPVELGDVQWLRDLDAATDQARKQEKPIAILFQEVPG